MPVNVIGAGLAGCEAAWQLARFGIDVNLYDMKPNKFSPAHKSDYFAELVCSNSLRSDRLSNAVGLLKEEMRYLKSLIIESADKNRIPAGGALAVDRDNFSKYISDKIANNHHINVIHKEICDIPKDEITIVATGPLTSDCLSKAISELEGLKTLSFYDAAAPIITKDSLNFDKVFYASRYDRGSDYINCPFNEEEYFNFVHELQNAECATVHGFEENKVFEACMPVESMAKRGDMTLAFGPLKPVGLVDPNTGKMPFAVVQLRSENANCSLYNIVGFQTKLTFPEQKRVFSMIPGLENVEFARFGVMHRNTFLHSPGFLDNTYRVINQPNLSFAGQITGVEGYVESAASGLLCALYRVFEIKNIKFPKLESIHAISAMAEYVSLPNAKFQPMNCAFGLLPELEGKRIRNKQMRYEQIAKRSLDKLKDIAQKIDSFSEIKE